MKEPFCEKASPKNEKRILASELFPSWKKGDIVYLNNKPYKIVKLKRTRISPYKIEAEMIPIEEEVSGREVK